jgi:hypothetical protein
MDINVTKYTVINTDRAVAHVDIGPISLGSMWIVDRKTDPKVSWPRTARGYPLISVKDAGLREQIERMVLKAATSS